MSDINDRTGNNTLYDEDFNPVKIFLNASGNRLAVDATISGDESPTKYAVRSHIDAVGQVVTTAADVILFQFTGLGVLDYIGVSSGNASYELALDIDGTEAYRVTMGELSSLGQSNATNVPIWAENANKNFRYHPNVGSGFESVLTVYGRATVGTQTLKHMVLYREKV